MKRFSTLSLEELQKKANAIRKDVVDVCVKNGAGHIAPSLSPVDLLTALYYNQMNVGPNPHDKERDRLVFSKAHGCYSLYAILSDLGYIPREEWLKFYKGAHLAGCVEQNLDFGIEVSCGSLGHGLPLAVGLAFGLKLQHASNRVYCIAGDGEMQEGSMWEAVQFAVKHELNNLVLIIDNNKLQAMDFVDNVLTVKDRKDDLEIKLNAFGMKGESTFGHDMAKLLEIFNRFSSEVSSCSKPRFLIANTIKGYGLKCMENVPKFHFRLPTEDELKQGNSYER